MMEDTDTTDKMVEDLNCGFCLHMLTYMIEPKQLPCTHVFCLPYLKEDPRKDCPICGYVKENKQTCPMYSGKVQVNTMI